MKKNLLLCFLLLVLIYLLFNRFAVQFVWVNPNVNTDVFPYIAKAVREIDNALNHTVLAMKSSQSNVKIIYKNAYGSGFLKNNPIPNDLDYSIGVHLGEYEFDGTNSAEIAKSIDQKMTLFQTEFYNYINDIAPGNLYSNYDIMSSLQVLFDKRENNIKSISASIPQLFHHKDYVIYTNKLLYDEKSKEYSMMFPFILKENEILIEDYKPVELFSNTVKYDTNTRNFLREITIVTDFYVDITKDKDKVKAEIVAESFTGQRLQLSRRFFVPIAFTGNSSANYLKNLEILNDDDLYIEYRLFNFRRHLQEFTNLKELQERPLKLLKRILQCTDLIEPVIDPSMTENIFNIVRLNMENPKIQLINDFQTSFSNLIQITSMPNLYLKLQYKNKITEHINMMSEIVEEMKNTNQFKPEEIDKLETFTNDLKEQVKMINSEFKLKDFNKKLITSAKPLLYMTDEIIINSVTDLDKLLEYIETFNKIMKKAGFHRIELCWLDKNLIGIVKDDYTSKIPETDLAQMAKENNLADVNYKFISPEQLSGPKVRYSLWVRYNSDKTENEIWQTMREQLLDDKRNFRLKRKFILSTK